MKQFALLLPVSALSLSLAACGEDPAPKPQPTPTEAPVSLPSMPAPDQQIFAAALAKACPDLEPVSTAICKRAGFGSTDVICDYGLGQDEYRRNQATLTPDDGEWTIADPESVCAPNGAE